MTNTVIGCLCRHRQEYLRLRPAETFPCQLRAPIETRPGLMAPAYAVAGTARQIQTALSSEGAKSEDGKCCSFYVYSYIFAYYATPMVR